MRENPFLVRRLLLNRTLTDLVCCNREETLSETEPHVEILERKEGKVTFLPPLSPAPVQGRSRNSLLPLGLSVNGASLQINGTRGVVEGRNNNNNTTGHTFHLKTRTDLRQLHLLVRSFKENVVPIKSRVFRKR